MIEVGSLAPDFEVTDAQGTKFRLSSLRGRHVVLYFFPMSFTGGCTMETRQFIELAPELARAGAQVVGISVDRPETLHRFATYCGAAFPLLSDRAKRVSRQYGVLSFIGFAKRVTFFIDPEGIVRDVVSSVLPGPHVARAKERFLRAA
jgi:peroxiredoxin Q/BCP